MEFPAVRIAFGVMALLAVGGGFGVVTGRNLVHAALSLIVALFGVAGLFVLLEAPFLAAVQVLIYIGAIAVLIMIAIMVARVAGERESVNRQWPLALLIGVVLLVTLGMVLVNQFGDVGAAQAAPPENSLALLGASLVNPNAFVLPFEVASVLLLAAMIGAIVIARD
jgi:NADH-quinone oxidoreductase subunit J